ncbi:putative GTP-binding protein P8A3.11c mitochondrial [Ceratocystis lukuohia]|uniref:GTP-binding protein P8A3.11c mitochondrial n=1 Tax=Ceratocystis lukuohia TaxID=2019550 RepID=A0ABR4MMY1_9PEZI
MSRCFVYRPYFLPFLYPCFRQSSASNTKFFRSFSTTLATRNGSTSSHDLPHSHLNPAPDDYAAPTFADKATLSLHAGAGGNGCVAFLREAYMPDGPANGGDGGHGGNVYIQAVPGETSLYKLSRQTFVKAGRGKHGRGSAKAGSRGEDVVITVPVGTVVREISRSDPAADEAALMRARKAAAKQRRREERLLDQAEKEAAERGEPFLRPVLPEIDDPYELERSRFVTYPGLSRPDVKSLEMPRLPKRNRLYAQPAAPITLDLTRPTPKPVLLAAGGIGGLGNPHFVCKERPRPMIATKGENAVRMDIELELKLLADVGLVGLPNAGKSTLLRLISKSRTRVGNWAFTTLQPNIGTVVLDSYRGRLPLRSFKKHPAAPHLGMPDPEIEREPRTRFTVADIPGLVQGAHLDRGLGISFLRHVERARVLAFVVDLSAGEAVDMLKALWKEVGLYAQMRDEEEANREIDARVDWDLTSTTGTGEAAPFTGVGLAPPGAELPADHSPRTTAGLDIAGKPWFVVGTKADLPATQDNFARLKAYIDALQAGSEPHPTGIQGAWTHKVSAIPISAIRGHGTDAIINWTVGLLD